MVRANQGVRPGQAAGVEVNETIRGFRVGAVQAIYPRKDYVYAGDLTLDKDPAAQFGRAPKLKPQSTGPKQRGFSPEKCGTPAGHQRHLYWNVPICQPCRDAKTKYSAERKAQIQARKEAAA